MADDELGGAGEPLPSGTRRDTARGDPEDSPEAPGRAISRLPPYLLTAGRTEPVDETLEIEAQVITTELGAAAQLSFEHRDIVNLCATAMSVAEVADSIGLHIGVARVLVADLAAQGYLVVRRPGVPDSQETILIERLIRGLKSIR